MNAGLELAYEEHRYHDARRWMIPATTVGRGIKAIKVTATLKPGKSSTGSLQVMIKQFIIIPIPWWIIQKMKPGNGMIKCITGQSAGMK